jgi:type II secretory pathway component PulK
MNRRGTALLLVLWLLVLLTGLVAVSLGDARIGLTAGRNRLALVRAGWAREACLEILLGRVASKASDWNPEQLSLDSVDLGEGIWCRLELHDPGKQLHLNLASRIALLALVRDSALVETLIRHRPWPAVEAVLGLADLGTRPAPPWVSLLTVRGTGRVNLNRAPLEVLETLPGLDEDGARALVARRGLRRPLRSLDEAVRELPPATRARVLAQYQAFANAASLAPEQLIAVVTGRIRDGPVAARATITLVPTLTRLAVIRRETE